MVISRSLPVGIAVIAVLASGCAALALEESPARSLPAAAIAAESGCRPAEKVAFDVDWDPLVIPWGQPPEPIIRQLGPDATDREATDRGFALATQLLSSLPVKQFSLLGPGTFVEYFSDVSLDGSDTPSDFFKAGGIAVVQREPVQEDIVAVIRATVGDRATVVSVGPFAAAMVHADPLPNGVRVYNIWWNDGQHEWRIQAGVADAVALLDIARSMVCGQ